LQSSRRLTSFFAPAFFLHRLAPDTLSDPTRLSESLFLIGKPLLTKFLLPYAFFRVLQSIVFMTFFCIPRPPGGASMTGRAFPPTLGVESIFSPYNGLSRASAHSLDLSILVPARLVSRSLDPAVILIFLHLAEFLFSFVLSSLNYLGLEAFVAEGPLLGNPVARRRGRGFLR